ncbi:MAG: sulfite exporter TauE/SafE family protein [Pseudomonadaceae bacterium]|nr:sulfite exporter TauE/SafE family protein [Pseudomonadaceae bacterium]
MEQVFFICLYIVLGLGSGFIGGLLGIGGGVVIVPALVISYDLTRRFAPEQSLLIAVATSLACIIFTSASAGYTQYRAGKVRWDLFQKLLAFLLLGSFLAGWIAPLLPPEVFRGFIGLFLAIVALIMLSNWQPDPKRRFPGFVGSASLGLGGGIAAGLAGIAGGNVIVPSLVFFNTPIHNATATASSLGVPIALMGTMGYLSSSGFTLDRGTGTLGFIDLYAFVPIVIGALIAAPQGVRFAHKVPAAKLKKLFGLLLVVVSVRMLYSAASF